MHDCHCELKREKTSPVALHPSASYDDEFLKKLFPGSSVTSYRYFHSRGESFEASPMSAWKAQYFVFFTCLNKLICKASNRNSPQFVSQPISLRSRPSQLLPALFLRLERSSLLKDRSSVNSSGEDSTGNRISVSLFVMRE